MYFNTGRLTVEEQKLEGEFRYVNSRLITNSEEVSKIFESDFLMECHVNLNCQLQVAFYQGNVREKLTILASFSKLTSHLRKFLEFRVGMGIIDNMIAKCENVLVTVSHIRYCFLLVLFQMLRL